MRLTWVVFAILTATIAVPRAVALDVSDEAKLRAAVNNSAVTEVVMTADMLLTAGHLVLWPGRNITLRGACGPTNVGACQLDASSLSRHLHVKPGAHVRVSNLVLVNGSTNINPEACSPFSTNMTAGRADGCVPEYYGFGPWIGLLGAFPGLEADLGYPAWGDKVREAPRSLP